MKTYIYALDLSLSSTGLCLFTNDGEFVKSFTIETKTENESQLRLKHIVLSLKDIVKEYPPEIVVIEQGFSRFNKSTQAIFKVHGIVEYLFSEYEQIKYPATTVKKVVGGKGNITKEKLRDKILEDYPDIKFKSLDESDAFAVGLTYFIARGIKNA